jgi:hypothetical protein
MNQYLRTLKRDGMHKALCNFAYAASGLAWACWTGDIRACQSIFRGASFSWWQGAILTPLHPNHIQYAMSVCAVL